MDAGTAPRVERRRLPRMDDRRLLHARKAADLPESDKRSAPHARPAAPTRPALSICDVHPRLALEGNFRLSQCAPAYSDLSRHQRARPTTTHHTTPPHDLPHLSVGKP